MSKTYLSAALLVAFAGTAYAGPDNDGPVTNNVQLRAPKSDSVGQSAVNSLVFEVSDFRTPTAPGGGGFFGRSNLCADSGMIPAVITAFPLNINGAAFAYTIRGQAAPIPEMSFRIRLFDNVDVSVNNTDTTAPFYSTQSGAITFISNNPQGSNPGAGGAVGLYFFDALNFAGTFVIPLADGAFAYDLTTFLESPIGTPTTIPHPTVDPIVRNGVLTAIGSSDARAWSDLDPATSSGTNFRSRSFGFATINSVFRPAFILPGADAYVKLQANIDDPTPPANIDLGTLNPDCGTLIAAEPIAVLTPGAVIWYKFTLGPSGSTFNQNTFLDLNTAINTGDVGTTMALFSSGGVRIALGDGNGAGALFSRLSFGDGRRANDGSGGIDPDGRHGDLAPGTYYLGVTGQGATFGTALFAVNATQSGASESVAVRFETNVRDTGPDCTFPAPVAPTATNLGTLAPSTTLSSTPTAGTLAVNWFTFQLPYEICNGKTGFLDIDNLGTVFGPTDMGLFDANGNGATANYFDVPSGPPGTDADRSGANGNAQLSFGNASNPRPAQLGNPNGVPFASQNLSSSESLAAETLYYLATALNDTEFASTGWRARSNSGSNVTQSINIVTSALSTGDCVVSNCFVDFNADGFLTQEDLGGFLTAFLDESIPPGPSGTNTFPCPGEPAPYDVLGYAADYNRDCSFNQDDLSGYITDYFGETENPTNCIPG